MSALYGSFCLLVRANRRYSATEWRECRNLLAKTTATSGGKTCCSPSIHSLSAAMSRRLRFSLEILTNQFGGGRREDRVGAVRGLPRVLEGRKYGPCVTHPLTLISTADRASQSL